MDVEFTAALTYFLDQAKKNPGFNLGLNGDLGVGKTYFVSHLVGSLDPNLAQEVSSPSFSFCNTYLGDQFKIDHFDLYRLEEVEQLDEIGLYESFDDQQTITLVEWSSMFRRLNRFFDYFLTLSQTEERRNYHIESTLI